MPNEPPSLLSCRVAPPPLSSSRRNIGPLSLLCDEIRTREAEIDWRRGSITIVSHRVRRCQPISGSGQGMIRVKLWFLDIPSQFLLQWEASCACGPFSVCCPSLVSFFTLSLSPKSRVERAAATAKRRSNYCGKTHTLFFSPKSRQHCFSRITYKGEV